MTSLSRIARLAQIPEIRKKKRDTSDHKKKKDQNHKEEPPIFSLRDTLSLQKPKTTVLQKTTTGLKKQKQSENASQKDQGIGEHLDLKV